VSVHKYNRSSHISNGLVSTQLTGEHVFCSKQKFTADSHDSDPLCDITVEIFICNTIFYLLSKSSQSLFITYYILKNIQQTTELNTLKSVTIKLQSEEDFYPVKTKSTIKLTQKVSDKLKYVDKAIHD
jgi:hypothetical protein